MLKMNDHKKNPAPEILETEFKYIIILSLSKQLLQSREFQNRLNESECNQPS